MNRAALVALLALLACDEPAGEPDARDAALGAGDLGADTAAPSPDAATADASPDAEADARMGDALSDAAPGDGDAPDAAPAPLAANPGPSRYALVGEPVVLDGSASTGPIDGYQWDFGNGERWETPRSEATATVVYATPGRYRATLTVSDAAGNRRTATAVITATHPPAWSPAQSSTLAWTGDGRLAVVVTDADQVALLDPAGGAVRRLATARAPRTLAVGGDRLAVACQEADALDIFGPGDAHRRVSLPPASRPFGVVGTGGAFYVTLQATGQVARIDDGDEPAQIWDVIPDARGIAALPDGRLAVTRWRSQPTHGAIAVLDPDTGAVEPWTLAFDPQPASDTEIGGVPSYLEAIVVSPTAAEVAFPSLQANLGHGLFVNGTPFRHDLIVRAVISYADPATGAERFEARKQLDSRGFAAAAVYTARGDYLFVADRGARTIDRLDRFNGDVSGTLLDVGYAVDGLALSPDDRLLFAHASLSREVVVYDVSDLRVLPEPLRRIRTVDPEPLPAVLLRGKQLFNDSFDPRLARDGYVSCAHCHLDGDSDRFVWDFTDRGEGLRNTVSLLGRAGEGHGPIHWTGNFDEIQDFEHDLRGPFGGAGLLDDADFHAALRDAPLGGPKAGVSPDLDALAAYVASLDRFPPSPHRQDRHAIERGRLLFESPALGCTGCHHGSALTDSAFLEPGVPRLHDVGTLGPGSGQRLGGPLPGIDTPTLWGLWDSAPYLHDGSAPTLRAVLTHRNPDDRHGATRHLDDEALADLEAFLLSLGGE